MWQQINVTTFVPEIFETCPPYVQLPWSLLSRDPPEYGLWVHAFHATLKKIIICIASISVHFFLGSEEMKKLEAIYLCKAFYMLPFKHAIIHTTSEEARRNDSITKLLVKHCHKLIKSSG